MAPLNSRRTFLRNTCALAFGVFTASASGVCRKAGRTLRLVAHESFSANKDTLDSFSREFDVTIQIISKLGDAGEVLDRLVLTKNDPLGDLVFGIDNVSYLKALDHNLLESYRSPELDNVDSTWCFDPTHHVTPIDYGYVGLNYDKASCAQIQIPARLEDLALPPWKGRLAVQNPETSSPGQQFMLATIAYFGDHGPFTWLDYWKRLRANNVHVSRGWEESYKEQFSRRNPSGEAWIVNSYTTSPCAEVVDSPTGRVPATGNLQIPKASYLQIEGVGLLKRARNPDLAKTFIDFMLREQFQKDLPQEMYVYPVRKRMEKYLTEFSKCAESPPEPARLDPERIKLNWSRWLREWTSTVIA